MATERLGGGSMSVNMYKKSDAQPDRRGKLKIDRDLPAGEYEIAGWLKKNEQGENYLSLSLSAAYVKPEGDNRRPAPGVPPNAQAPRASGQRPTPQAPSEPQKDDTIPF